MIDIIASVCVCVRARTGRLTMPGADAACSKFVHREIVVIIKYHQRQTASNALDTKQSHPIPCNPIQ